jgi:hypothetical protein
MAAALLLLTGGTACTGVYMGGGMRGGYYPWGYGYGRAPFYGYGGNVIVVPPDCGIDCGGGIDPDYPEAVPLPEPPPDMGMPDFGGGMDMGGMDMGPMDMGDFD